MTTLTATRPRAAGWQRSPVSWVIVALALFGAVIVGRDFRPIAVHFAGQALLATGALVLIGLAGWWLLSRIRPIRPVPRTRALAAIAWGMTGATGCAILANTGLKSLWARTAGVDFASDWGDAVTAPINEETLKMVGLVLLILAVSPWVRGPMEGFVYGSLIGLGFQILEDWIYAMNSIVLNGGVEPTNAVVQSIVIRVGLTGLGSHWAMSAVAGAGIGFLLHRRGSARRTAAGIGLLVLAPLMHWSFDSPLLAGGLGVIVKTLLNFAIAMAVYIVLRRRLRAAARAELTGHAELTARADGGPGLLTRHGRRRELARQPAGEARRSAARAQLAQLALVEDRAYAAA